MRAPLNRYIMEVEIVTKVQVDLKASTPHAASKKALEHPSVGGANGRVRVIASWPAREPQEIESDLGGGYRVRRGWFYEVAFSGGKYGHGERTVSFPAALVEKGEGVALHDFNSLVEAPEKARYFIRRFGYASTHESLKTWSRVQETANLAYKATRRFIEESKQFVRDRQRRDRERAERIRMENLMDKAVGRMLHEGGALTRLKGGKWVTNAPGYYPDGEPQTYEEKWLIELLLAEGHVEVTDTMNQSGDPRVVTLTDFGKARAELLEHTPPSLVVS